VELPAYFWFSETLAKIAKYANASHARVRVERVNGQVEVEVSDDGVGGADPTRGTGLQGLRDRVCGVDGTFEVESEPGAGTVVRAEIPCGQPSPPTRGCCARGSAGCWGGGGA